jgi:hypothetical protein
MLNNSKIYRTLIKQEMKLVGYYSLRQLSGYSGSAIRVRRSSDNTEQDIGFSSGVLDNASLSSFVGAGDGFVTAWYEQTGFGNDLKNSGATSQPQIVFSGTIQTSGGFTCIYFDGVDDRLIENNFIPPFKDFTTKGRFSVFSIFEPTVIDSRNHVYIHADRATPRFSQIGRISSGKAEMISFNTSVVNYTDNDTTSLSINTKYLTSSIRRVSDIEIYTNGVSNGPYPTSGEPIRKSIQLEVGCRLFPTEAFEGNLFEFALYNLDADNTTRQDIENEMITYYGI